MALRELGIRKETLTCFEQWVAPTPEEIKTVVERISLIRGKRLFGADIAQIVGVSGSRGVGRGSRTFRRWVAGESVIPYSVWCILCYEAGYGVIWDSHTFDGDSNA